MTEIIKFPYKHRNILTVKDIKDMLDELPENLSIKNFTVMVDGNNGKIYTVFDGDDSLRTIASLEIVKQDVIKKMNKD